MPHTIEPIAILQSPYTDKFGIPRQPGLAPSALGRIKLLPPFNTADAVRGLEEFSHIWLIFLFHRHLERKITPTVRPPRLGGNQRIGVFASRSSFRPNHLGQSAVRLQGIQYENGQPVITVSGIDLLDGTPIVDIKPYIPYSDSHPEATASFASAAPRLMQVKFSESAEQQLTALAGTYPELRQLLVEILQQDPRPAYKTASPDREYGFSLYSLNIRFRVSQTTVDVTHISA